MTTVTDIINQLSKEDLKKLFEDQKTICNIARALGLSPKLASSTIRKRLKKENIGYIPQPLEDRESVIRQVSSEDFVIAVGRSTSLGNLLEIFGLVPSYGYGRRLAKIRIEKEKVDVSHWRGFQTKPIKNAKSVFWTISDDVFKFLISQSTSVSDFLSRNGYSISGPQLKAVQKRCDLLKVYPSRSHQPINREKIPLKDLFREDSTYNRGSVKRRIFKDALLENKCAVCGDPPMWKGKELVLVLDHINGSPYDHRIENLRLLCPNCNSQTETFAGRKLRINNKCKTCKKPITNRAVYCTTCSNKRVKRQPRKVPNRPPLETLLAQTEEHGFSAVGRMYGVSDNAIRKWIKHYQKQTLAQTPLPTEVVV